MLITLVNCNTWKTPRKLTEKVTILYRRCQKYYLMGDSTEKLKYKKMVRCPQNLRRYNFTGNFEIFNY